MARYQINLVYDGTDFCGFQRQREKRTVQGVVEEGLHRIGWQGKSILAAGRTDTGVHALGQVIAFDMDWTHPAAEMQSALNANLPADVAVQTVLETESGFHPRYYALARRYRYQILICPVRNPLQERYAWRVWPDLDVESLKTATRSLIGVHDFGAFGRSPRLGGHTRRELFQAEWEAVDNQFTFDVTGDAFLYRMVRRMVGVLVQIGLRRLPVTFIDECLERPAEPMAVEPAPPHGLTLLEVVYPPAMP